MQTAVPKLPAVAPPACCSWPVRICRATPAVAASMAVEAMNSIPSSSTPNNSAKKGTAIMANSTAVAPRREAIRSQRIAPVLVLRDGMRGSSSEGSRSSEAATLGRRLLILA